MDKRKEPRDIPVSVELAAHRFAAACKHSGWDKCVVLTCGDGLADMLTHSDNGEPQTLVYIGGSWFEYVNVEGDEHGN